MKASRHVSSPRRVSLARCSEARLLDLRLCDLPVSLERSKVAAHVQRLYRELAARGLEFRPHVWLADEWFSPDGVPGFAVPFYLMHPRLIRLERKMMREAEGGNARWLMRILRHEAGHALDSAYGLRRRKDWRAVFGSASKPYPKVYRPMPLSRRHVLHLGNWYAQTHPTEDFAETFAVWLQPRSQWRRQYAGWPARRKLEYVDALMKELRSVRPQNRTRAIIEPLKRNRQTLRAYYARKRTRYQIESNDVYDAALLRVFARATTHQTGMSAATLLRSLRPGITRSLFTHAHLHPYLVHNVMRMVIERCRELNLVVRGSKNRAQRPARLLVERIVFDRLHRRRQQYVL